MRFILSLSNFIELFTRFYIIYFISKILGIEVYGTYSYYIALGQFLSFIFMFGIGPTLLRYIELNKRVYNNLISASFYIFIIVASVLFFFIDFYFFTFFTFYYVLTISIYILNSKELFIHSSILRIIIYSVQLSLINYYAYTSFDELIQIYTISNILLFILFILLIKNSFLQLNLQEIKLVKSYLIHIYFSQISMSGLKYFEKLITSKILDAQSFGIFSLIRDITNALVYVLYYPIQVIYYKKILLSFRKQENILEKYKKIVMKIFFLCFLGVCLVQFNEVIVYIGSFIEGLNIFINNDSLLYTIIVLVFSESIFRLNMMYFDIIGIPIQNSYISIFNIIMLNILFLINMIASISIISIILFIILSYILATIYFYFKFKKVYIV